MRSVERHSPTAPRPALCALAAAAALATLAGCGSVGMRLRDALPGASASAPASTPAASAAAAASAASAAVVVAKPASTGPIVPATQRAYDDALALMRAGHAADAERGLRALTKSDPDLAGPHANLGMLARQAGHLPEAVSELEKATTLAPGLLVAWNQLGLAYRQQGEFTKARGAYDSALALDPNYATAVLNLGVLNDLYLGDGARALELYTRYLALTPGGDAVVTKWVAEVKNRKPAAGAPAASAPAAAAAPKEKS
jgi:tetratricopeptide (TPR) repeat protein